MKGDDNMKRITSACLDQTIKFDAMKECNPQEDFKSFLNMLEKKHTKYEVMDSQTTDDGSLIVKIKKQYTDYSTEGYMK